MQPKLFVPVTVKIVVAFGVTATVGPKPPNVDQEYVPPPLAVKVAASPAQIEPLELTKVTVGFGFTVTVIGVLLTLTVQVFASA